MYFWWVRTNSTVYYFLGFARDFGRSLYVVIVNHGFGWIQIASCSISVLAVENFTDETIGARFLPSWVDMNGHSNHNHVNGQAHRTEEEEAQLDAYQEELVHEAILDEVKVQTTPTFPLNNSRPFSQPKKLEFHCIENLKRIIPMNK